jgi:hypothetical protein
MLADWLAIARLGFMRDVPRISQHDVVVGSMN